MTPICVILFCVCAAATVHGLDPGVVVLRAVRGRDARLPCGQGKVFLDGPNAHVLWVKDDRDFLYRFPNEETESGSMNSNHVYGVACDLGTCYDETSLLLKKVNEHDSGMYRCRVHYQASPSVDYVIEVRLVDAPGMPRITNAAGEEIKTAHVGPLGLGSNLTLICEVDDDQPDTLVYWRRNGVVIERAHSVRKGVLRADVHIKNATRDEFDAHYECMAQNADVTEPLSAGVVVKMYLPPLQMEIRLNKNLDFEAGQPRVVDCVVVGCVPPPSITWHLGDSLLRPSIHKELNDGNYTLSSLTLAPSLRDNHQELVCRAHNSLLPTSVFEEKVVVNVGHRPTCLAIREETVGVILNETETITCQVEAVPAPMQFSWTFPDSKILYTSVKMSSGHNNRYTSSLTWRPSKSDVGTITCRAVNSLGEQRRPCLYAITLGGPPRTPVCVVMKSFLRTIRLQCRKAWDGGRSQLVHLELFSTNGDMLHNVSNAAGHFSIPDNDDETNMTAIVYASNIRGRSDKKVIFLHNLPSLRASAIANEDLEQPEIRWKEIVAGTVAVTSAVLAITLCVKVIRNKEYDVEHQPDIMPRSEGTFHREPDFIREDRTLGTTNITVNHLASYPNLYTSSPKPTCRVMLHAAPCSSKQDDFVPSLESYYV